MVDSNIPDIILTDAKEHGYAGVLYGGEFEKVHYFYCFRENRGRYSGLPCIVKLVDGKIVDVTDFQERGRAFKFATRNRKTQ